MTNKTFKKLMRTVRLAYNEQICFEVFKSQVELNENLRLAHVCYLNSKKQDSLLSFRWYRK